MDHFPPWLARPPMILHTHPRLILSHQSAYLTRLSRRARISTELEQTQYPKGSLTSGKAAACSPVDPDYCGGQQWGAGSRILGSHMLASCPVAPRHRQEEVRLGCFPDISKKGGGITLVLLSTNISYRNRIMLGTPSMRVTSSVCRPYQQSPMLVTRRASFSAHQIDARTYRLYAMLARKKLCGNEMVALKLHPSHRTKAKRHCWLPSRQSGLDSHSTIRGYSS